MMETKYANQTWAVTIDRPYYPSIEYFATQTEAVACAEKMRAEQNDGEDAVHEAAICVVKVVAAHKIRTHY